MRGSWCVSDSPVEGECPGGTQGDGEGENDEGRVTRDLAPGRNGRVVRAEAAARYAQPAHDGRRDGEIEHAPAARRRPTRRLRVKNPRIRYPPSRISRNGSITASGATSGCGSSRKPAICAAKSVACPTFETPATMKIPPIARRRTKISHGTTAAVHQVAPESAACSTSRTSARCAGGIACTSVRSISVASSKPAIVSATQSATVAGS